MKSLSDFKVMSSRKESSSCCLIFEVPFLEAQRKRKLHTNGGVAQLGEHLLCKQGVIGSIPFISTSGKRKRTPTERICGLIAQQVRAHA